MTQLIEGAVNGIDCQVRLLDDERRVLEDWHGDDGHANCFLRFEDREYNNQWIEFKFDIPVDYTCSNCWVWAKYFVKGGITDRTTWTARLNGQPIRLVE